MFPAVVDSKPVELGNLNLSTRNDGKLRLSDPPDELTTPSEV